MPGSHEKRGKNSWRYGIPMVGADGRKQWVRRSIKFPDAMSESAQVKELERLQALLYAEV